MSHCTMTQTFADAAIDITNLKNGIDNNDSDNKKYNKSGSISTSICCSIGNNDYSGSSPRTSSNSCINISNKSGNNNNNSYELL